MLILPHRGFIERAPQFRPLIGRGWPSHPFTLVARTPDGRIVWLGRFRNRDELDIFLWSLSRGELVRDEFARGLSFPIWKPGLAELPLVYQLAISVVTIGHYQTSGKNLSITIPTGGVPTGALIVVGASSYNYGVSSFASTPSDTINTFSTVASKKDSDSFVVTYMFYSANVSALTSSNSITLTAPSGEQCDMGAFCATGIAQTSPLDSAVTETAETDTGGLSITSGTPSVSGEMFAVVCGSYYNSGTFTQDTGHGWSTPFSYTNGSYGGLAGGYEINTGTGTIKWAPSFSTRCYQSAVMAGFKPAPSITTGFNMSMLGM